MKEIDKLIEKVRKNSGIKRMKVILDNKDYAVEVFGKLADARLESKNCKFKKSEIVPRLIDWLYVLGEYDTDYHKGVMLKGGTGRGKTFLMDVFSDFCRIDGLQYQSCGNVHYILPRKVNARKIASDFASQGYDSLKQYELHGLIIIDDIGAEDDVMFYGNKVSPIAEVIAIREERNLLTFGTTNLNKLSERYDDRTISRMSSMFNILAIDNSVDFRKHPNKKNDAKSEIF